jgi:hypothetical protein
MADMARWHHVIYAKNGSLVSPAFRAFCHESIRRIRIVGLPTIPSEEIEKCLSKRKSALKSVSVTTTLLGKRLMGCPTYARSLFGIQSLPNYAKFMTSLASFASRIGSDSIESLEVSIPVDYKQDILPYFTELLPFIASSLTSLSVQFAPRITSTYTALVANFAHLLKTITQNAIQLSRLSISGFPFKELSAHQLKIFLSNTNLTEVSLMDPLMDVDIQTGDYLGGMQRSKSIMEAFLDAGDGLEMFELDHRVEMF